MRLRRVMSAALLATLAVTGLSACQSKVGLAAAVNDVRLSDSDLSSYIKPGTAPYLDTSTDKTVVPKLYVLEAWLQTTVFERAIAATSAGPITSSELAASRAALLGSQTLSAVETGFAKQGYTNKLGDLIVDRSAVLVVLVQRLVKGATLAQAVQALQSGSASNAIIQSVTASKPDVVVSGRYGTWDPKTLALSADSTAGLPSFVTQAGVAATDQTAG